MRVAITLFTIIQKDILNAIDTGYPLTENRFIILPLLPQKNLIFLIRFCNPKVSKYNRDKPGMLT